MTVKQFLKTDEAREAAEYTGNSRLADFSADSDGRVGRAFSGAYTVYEVRALLDDLERVQAAYDAWQPAGDAMTTCARCGQHFPADTGPCGCGFRFETTSDASIDPVTGVTRVPR